MQPFIFLFLAIMSKLRFLRWWRSPHAGNSFRIAVEIQRSTSAPGNPKQPAWILPEMAALLSGLLPETLLASPAGGKLGPLPPEIAG